MKRRFIEINNTCEEVGKELSPAEQILRFESDANNPYRKLLFNPYTSSYVGFMNIADLNIDYTFLPSNRIINRKVIERRVQENIDCFKKTGKLLDFGTAMFVVIRQDKNNKFMVVDGQHRLMCLQELKNRKICDKLFIQVSIKVVDSEADARDYLMLFQKQYISDKRLFSTTIDERCHKERIIEMFRNIWVGAFKEFDDIEMRSINGLPCKNHRIEIERPHLSDGLVVGLMNKINILRSSKISRDALIEMNEFLRGLYDEKSISRKVNDVCDGCMFGMLRDDKEDMKKIEILNNRWLG